jgi:hypothetical protein
MSSVHWPPTQEPVTMAAFSRKLGRPGNSGVADGLARGDHGELRETVHEVGAAVVEVWLMAVTLYLGAVLEAELGAVGGFNGGDAGAALAKRLREFRGIPAQSADRAHAGDGHAPHALLAGFRAVGFGGDQLLDALAHLADVAHVAHLVVGNADIEFIFEGEEDFDGIHGIDPQLLEIALDRHRWKGNALGGGDHLQHPLDQFVGHSNRLSVSNL